VYQVSDKTFLGLELAIGCADSNPGIVDSNLAITRNEVTHSRRRPNFGQHSRALMGDRRVLTELQIR
jgi:hypothetical protein